MFSADEYAAVHERAGFLEREDVGRLCLRGQDRRSYLHGILTNDIEGLAAGEGRYAALLTPQGRMITDMHVFELGDVVLVMLPVSEAAAIRDRLDQYIFSEDVQVEDATARTIQFGVYGPGAAGIVARLSFPEAPVVVPARDFGLEGVEVIAAREQVEELRQALLALGAAPVSIETLEVCRVEAGIPRFLVDMTPDTIPLEAGIEAGAISMTKGCYPGQEVIVRVLHRGGGRVAKRLVRLLFPAGVDAPVAGAVIRAGDREIGTVTSVAQSPRLGRPMALGYVHRDFVAPGTAVSVGGSVAEVAPLPG